MLLTFSRVREMSTCGAVIDHGSRSQAVFEFSTESTLPQFC